MSQRENEAEKCVVLITDENSEIAYGPFYSFEKAQETLGKIGFKRINDACWQKEKIDAYIRRLNPPDKMGK